MTQSEIDTLMDHFLILSPSRSPAPSIECYPKPHPVVNNLVELACSKSSRRPIPKLNSWTEQEDQLLISQARKLGIRYKEISIAFNGTRSGDSCKRRLYLLKRNGRLPDDLQLIKQQHQSSATEKPIIGVTFINNKKAWIAKCNIAGKTVKKSFSLSRYGDAGAKEMAIAARAQMIQQKQTIEQEMGAAAPKSSNQFYKRQ